MPAAAVGCPRPVDRQPHGAAIALRAAPFTAWAGEHIAGEHAKAGEQGDRSGDEVPPSPRLAALVDKRIAGQPMAMDDPARTANIDNARR
jgi:hypothetical protein